MGRTTSNHRFTWRRLRRSNRTRLRVEVAPNDGMVVIRDATKPDGPVLTYTTAEWSVFLDKVKNGEFDNPTAEGQRVASGSSPQNEFATASLRDCLRALISDTTKSEETLSRHLELFRFARSTVREVLAAVLVGSLIFGGGVAAAVAVAGAHIVVAIGIGAGGSATFVLTAAIRIRRYLRAVLTALSATDRDYPQSGPGAPEAHVRRTAA